ncbi:MAG: ferric reductase [Candidatus Rokuibacteriota bacterium]|nr:MAG: ferric reductase [Candidatus Rokubacteria bacterium]
MARGDGQRSHLSRGRRGRQGLLPPRPRGPGLARYPRTGGTVPLSEREDALQPPLAAVARGPAGRGVTLASTAFDWYAARAGGVVAYLLLSLAVVLGLALAGKERLDGWPRFALEEVHRFAGVLAGVFIVLHVGLIVIDSKAHFSLVQAIVPFAASYRPLWTGLGIVAAELLVGLAVANRYRKRMPYRTWRRLHYLNFAVWAAATGHGLGSGTDRGSAWLIWLYLCSIGAVVALTARRVGRGSLGRGARRERRPVVPG